MDWNREQVLEALKPREVYLPLMPNFCDRFRSVILTFDGAEILGEDPDVVKGLVIFKLKIMSLYHLFALGAVFHIDKQCDDIKEQHLAMALQASKNEN